MCVGLGMVVSTVHSLCGGTGGKPKPLWWYVGVQMLVWGAYAALPMPYVLIP